MSSEAFWQVYRTFGSDILKLKSFPLFIMYLIFCFGSSNWKKLFKQPLHFPKLLFAYNLLLSLTNVLCFLGFANVLARSDSWFDKKYDPLLQKVYYLYWLTKVVELMDTVFMVLRHKLGQVSTLHVYHHATMLLLSEIGYKKYFWAAFAMPLMLNALVHVFLYLYYGLTAIGYQPPWKQRLTEMQILQFLIDLVHGLVGFARHNFCFWSIMYACSMIYFFGSFYIKHYVKSRPDSNKKSS